jgi:tungstate transport system permease protein
VLGVFLNTSMAIPSVFLGLLLYALFSRQGPFGLLGLTWLYTPLLMVVGQALLAAPIIGALTRGILERVDPRVYETALTMGAGPVRAVIAVLREYRGAIGSAVAAGFARALTEVGCAWIVGGNIRGQTRVITTSVVYHTVRGEFGTSFALGLVLFLIALVVNLFIWRATRVSVQEG